MKLFLASLRVEINKLAGAILVVGDFNVNFATNEGHRISSILAEFALYPTLDFKCPSTDRDSQIDTSFSNFKQRTTRFYKSTFSFHKTILITWSQDSQFDLSEPMETSATHAEQSSSDEQLEEVD